MTGFNMNSNLLKMLSVAFLLLLWTVLVWFKHDDGNLILAIQGLIAVVVGYHGVTTLQRVPPTDPTLQDQPTQPVSQVPALVDKQAGFANLPFLALMAGVVTLLGALIMTGCATSQASYVQSCAVYGASFDLAAQMRAAGKLNQSQIAAVGEIDRQVSKLCQGTLPTDLQSANNQVTAAVTTLALIGIVQKASK
jgi:hypothetical protein